MRGNLNQEIIPVSLFLWKAKTIFKVSFMKIVLNFVRFEIES